MPAPTAQKPSGIMTKRTLLIILVLVLALVGGLVMLLASGDNSDQLRQRLSARQDTTLAIVADGQKNITGDDLKKLNSELSLVLTGDNTDLQAALTAAGMKKVNKEVAGAETDSETFKKLTTAKLNAQYDTTYRRVLGQKLESLRQLIEELHGKTKQRGLKSVLATEYTHLTTYLRALEQLPN